MNCFNKLVRANLLYNIPIPGQIKSYKQFIKSYCYINLPIYIFSNNMSYTL